MLNEQNPTLMGGKIVTIHVAKSKQKLLLRQIVHVIGLHVLPVKAIFTRILMGTSKNFALLVLEFLSLLFSLNKIFINVLHADFSNIIIHISLPLVLRGGVFMLI